MKDKIINQYNAYGRQMRALFSALESLADERLNQKPENGGWSAIQTLHHLILVEEKSLAYVRKKLGFEDKFPKTDLNSHIRSGLLWLTLFSPIKFKAPQGVAENLPEYASLADTRERWEAAFKTWVQQINDLPVDLLDKKIYKHPRAGRQNLQQMICFFQWHLTRHAKQARRAAGV